MRVRLPWLIVAGSGLLAVLLLYVLFGAYLPARQRVASLETELKEVYAREAALQTKLAQEEQRQGLRDQRVTTLVTEREALVRRLEELQRELAAARSPARRR